jgi:U3 small nucleolar RNA-associated protein 4
MDAMKLHSRLPPPLNMDSWSAIHAMAFNETRVLAIACGTSNSLWTIDVETGEPLPWSLNLAKRNAHAPDALYNTPGQICGLSFAIGGGSEKGIVSSKRGKSASSRKSTAAANKDAGLPELVLFAHTPNAIARINLRSKITDDCVLSKLGKSKVLTGTAKKKRRQREKQLKEKQASQRVDGAIELPGGVRAVILNDPCLFFGNVGKDKALLVERPWVDVLRKMQKPLYRHRFGT